MGARRKKTSKKQLNGTEGKEKLSIGKVFLAVFGVSTAAGAAYLLYEGSKDKKDTSIVINNAFNPSGMIKSLTTKKRNDKFPLKKGSFGARVTRLQQALHKLLGGTGMNNYGGIDGDFGSGTESALIEAKLPTTIDEAAFNSIVGSATSGGGDLTIIFNPQEIANNLYYAARSANIKEVINQLSLIKSAKEYSDVSSHYQKKGIVKRTIVTDLLDFAFENNAAAKQQIRSEFLRMGLKNDASSAKWSLSGFKIFNDIITLRSTHVEDQMKNKIPVGANITLGEEIESANGMTWFKALDGTIGAVPSRDIKYVE